MSTITERLKAEFNDFVNFTSNNPKTVAAACAVASLVAVIFGAAMGGITNIGSWTHAAKVVAIVDAAMVASVMAYIIGRYSGESSEVDIVEGEPAIIENDA
jgi:hypothetical protein